MGVNARQAVSTFISFFFLNISRLERPTFNMHQIQLHRFNYFFIFLKKLIPPTIEWLQEGRNNRDQGQTVDEAAAVVAESRLGYYEYTLVNTFLSQPLLHFCPFPSFPD